VNVVAAQKLMSRCDMDTEERNVRSHSLEVLGLGSLGIGTNHEIIDKV
jgi:hypothetical protein